MFAVLVSLCGPLHAQPFRTDHVTAELVAERSAVQAGETLRVGLRLQHIPHWHSYWRNPGDSGLPTSLVWQLARGARVGEIEWPAPVRLPIGPLVNYGYEGDLLLPVRFTAPADARPGSTLTLRADASWLVCKDVCIPENAALQLKLPVVEPGVEPGGTAEAALFARAGSAVPVPLPAGWRSELQQAGRELLFTLAPADSASLSPSTAAALPPLEVFPFAEQVIEPAFHEAYRTPAGYAVKLRLLDNANLPASFDGVAVVRRPAAPWRADSAAHAASASAERSADVSAVTFTAPVRQVTALVMPAGAHEIDDAAAPLAEAAGADPGGVAQKLVDPTLLAALALAFGGGLLLNLMPCVFPVLSIKLLSLAQHADAGPAHLRRHAAFYGAGVVLTFVALAGLLLALRAAGSAVGWGFQLQEPGVVFALALLFFALALNLLGAFEFGQVVPQRLAAWRGRRPGVDAFASGVVAVLAASPCTAPFMGAALGYALTQPPAVGLAVFATLGIGMALPYAALVLSPGWRRRLPRPGAWMVRLKQGLAFPLFATVVWLLWVLGLQAGLDDVARALLALVAAGFGLWLFGLPAGATRAANGGTTTRRAGAAIVALGVAAALVWGWPSGDTRVSSSTAQASPANAGSSDWQPYDDAVLARHVAAGKPVFVDFTAAWCVSCQVNKRLVLNTDATRADFARAGVELIRADWTRRDARITDALARLGRNGVPVYVLLRPGREPLLLPEILTGRLVRDALATLQAGT